MNKRSSPSRAAHCYATILFHRRQSEQETSQSKLALGLKIVTRYPQRFSQLMQELLFFFSLFFILATDLGKFFEQSKSYQIILC